MTEEDEMKLTNVEIAYEDYVISLMQGKTAEQVDDTEFTPDQLESRILRAANADVRQTGSRRTRAELSRGSRQERSRRALV